MENEFPKRKNLRLKQYDYNAKGAYFVTICIKDRQRILSDITTSTPTELADPLRAPGDALQIRLTAIGSTVEKFLLSSENIRGVKIDRYVIMPDHIHAIVILDPDEYIDQRNGSSRAPTPTNKMLPRVVSSFKRLCDRAIGSNIFQRGYYEHVIRDKEDYDAIVRYIYENPMRWYSERKGNATP